MNSTQYNRINELLSEFSTITAAFESAEAEIKTLQLAAAKELLPKHAELKIKLSTIETQLRQLSNLHYAELFGDEADEKRTHATPFGSLKYHKSSSLEFDDAEKVLLKIKLHCEQEASRVRNLTDPPRFTAAQLIRSREEPNLSAMETLDDATLALFGVRRVHKDNFKIAPFTMKSDKPTKKVTAAA